MLSVRLGRSKYSSFVGGLFLLFVICSLNAAPVGPPVGKMVLVLGTVTGLDQDGDAFEVRRGADVHAGYTFFTSSRSMVRVQMTDGT